MSAEYNDAIEDVLSVLEKDLDAAEKKIAFATDKEIFSNSFAWQIQLIYARNLMELRREIKGLRK